MCIYLYVKTHNITGLKYLGKTVRKNPHTYHGSGKYWTRHLKIHGYDYTTEILKECQSNEELKEWGLYYSHLWNVVKSDEWANLKEECGDGGFGLNAGQHMRTEEHLQRMRENNPMDNLESRKKIGDKLRGVPKSEQHKKNMINPMTIPEIAAKRTGTGSPVYDHTIYTFYNKRTNVTEVCTQYELRTKYGIGRGNLSALVRGHIMQTAGWTLANVQ